MSILSNNLSGLDVVEEINKLRKERMKRLTIID